jgi:diguanylate cyclase (GGDEF)-like protein/PAS domain S-box-containing protein
MTSSRRVGVLVVAGLVVANLLVLILAGDSLYRSRQFYELRAETQTKNIASAVDQNISRSIEKIDLALRMVVNELEHRLERNGIDETTTNAFLAQQEKLLPETEAFRVAQADGLVILGKGLNKLERVSWADRDYFTYLRDHPNGGLHISTPIVGRVSKKPIIGFARRYNYPDGRFAGVVSAPIALSHFSALLGKFDIGPNGSAILRDADLGLIARVPAIPDKPAGQIGNSNVSKEFLKIYGSGVQGATYSTPLGADGFPRLATFNRLPEARMVVIIALAQQDYIAGWNKEVYRTVAMASCFLLLSLFLGYFLLRSLNKIQRNRQQLSDSDTFVHDIINSLSEHVAVIDSHGKIIKVNEAWSRFASNNGGADSAVSIGVNYIENWEEINHSNDRTEAIEVAEGIRSILDGSQQKFKHEYACHSPTEERWFTLNAVPLYGSQGGAVVIHRNITERKQLEVRQEIAKKQLEDQLTEISALQALLQDQAVRDSLTGLHNRRYLDETLSRDLSQAKRGGYPLTLVMVDIDFFKRVNDTYGHAAGDEVIKALAEILQADARESDMICRYGGEEFLISLPKMSIVHAMQRAEKWRLKFAETQVRYGEFLIQSTLSAGVAGYPDHGTDDSTLTAHADEALYSSKHEGRNRVTCFDPEASARNNDRTK